MGISSCSVDDINRLAIEHQSVDDSRWAQWNGIQVVVKDGREAVYIKH
jgi:hypothetical protein